MTNQATLACGALHLHDFSSQIFRNRRMLRIWVPPGYDDPLTAGRHYPVLYLNDGQNLFDPSTAYIGVDWQVGRSAEMLIREGRVPPLIIVGIDHAQNNRGREYLPYQNHFPYLARVKGKQYPDFLIREVMPFVRQHYRIAEGGHNTGLGGSSFGAVISLYTVMARPGVFGRLLLESPSLFVTNRRLIKDSHRVKLWPERIYLGVGTQEAGSDQRKNQAVVNDVKRLEEVLRHAGLGPDRLLVEIEQGARHSEGDWARRFPRALQFLFAEHG
jgi:predicted alpha/beta superfamily hydrolase